jgi:hypothetical protein
MRGIEHTNTRHTTTTKPTIAPGRIAARFGGEDCWAVRGGGDEAEVAADAKTGSRLINV